MDDLDLTADQTEKIVQFQDLTGIDNLSVCRDALQRHSWDLEVAVQDQLNISEGRPSVFASSETAAPPSVVNDGAVQHIFYSPPSGLPRTAYLPGLHLQQLYTGSFNAAVDLFVTSTLPNLFLSLNFPSTLTLYQFSSLAVRSADQPFKLVDDDYLIISEWGGPVGYVVSFVFQFCCNTLLGILKFVVSVFWREPRRQVTDPVGDVLKFIDTVNETMTRTHPVFYQGSYSQALNDAKQELRFLVVYLHQDNNQDCVSFCRETLANPEVIEYINGHSLFWSCNTSSGEGDRVCHTLKTSSFPFVGVIVYKESRMTLVARMEGPSSADELVNRLTSVIASNESYLEVARQERISRSLTQRIRREQDAAYLESLRADQEKDRKKSEEEEKKQNALREEREREAAERERKEAIKRAKIELATEIPDEPELSNPDTLSVVFKLPSGERIERRFLKSHKLKDVYNFVFCHPSSPDVFQIATNFPKRVLETDSSPEQTLINAGLNGSQVLFVYDLEA